MALKVAGHAMLGAVAASRMDLVTLDKGMISNVRCRITEPGLTLILRFLQRRQPARDFLCDRRGGIPAMAWPPTAA